MSTKNFKHSRKSFQKIANRDPLLIEDLHGVTYRKGKRFRIRAFYPDFVNYKSGSLTKDIIHNQVFNLVKTKNRIYAIYVIPETRCYVQYKLTIISYNELHDIRKSYLRGNIHHS